MPTADHFQGYHVSPRLALRVWQREVTLYKRIWPSTIFSTLMDPIVYLLAMGFGLGAYIDQSFDGVPYLQFIAPGLVASSVMFAAAFETSWNSYVRIHIERAYEAMMTTPATLEDVVAGELAWATTRATIYSVVMLGVLALFGLVRSPWALLVPFAGVLGGVTFATLGLTYTAFVKHIDQLTFWFTLFVTPMFLFSGIFFPISGLPVAVQWVAWFTPLFHLVSITRGLVLGDLSGLWIDVAWLVGLTLLVFPLPSRMLRKKLVV